MAITKGAIIKLNIFRWVVLAIAIFLFAIMMILLTCSDNLEELLSYLIQLGNPITILIIVFIILSIKIRNAKKNPQVDVNREGTYVNPMNKNDSSTSQKHIDTIFQSYPEKETPLEKETKEE